MVSGALRIGYPCSRAKSTRGERKNGFNMKLHIFHIIFLIFYVSFFSVTLNGRIWVVSFVWREICVLWLGPQNIVNLIWFFLLFNPYQRFFLRQLFLLQRLHYSFTIYDFLGFSLISISDVANVLKTLKKMYPKCFYIY